MTSVIQMSFQSKAAARSASFLRNDRSTGRLSGPPSLIAIYQSPASPAAAFSESYRGTSKSPHFADFPVRNSLISRLLTGSNRNKKNSREPCPASSVRVLARPFAPNFHTIKARFSHYKFSAPVVRARSIRSTSALYLQKIRIEKTANSHINLRLFTLTAARCRVTWPGNFNERPSTSTDKCRRSKLRRRRCLSLLRNTDFDKNPRLENGRGFFNSTARPVRLR